MITTDSLNQDLHALLTLTRTKRTNTEKYLNKILMFVVSVHIYIFKIFNASICLKRAGIPQSYSDSLRAGRSGNRIPAGARFSAPVQTGPGAYPASYKMGTGSFLGVKRRGRGAENPPPSSLWAFVVCSRVKL